MVPNLHANVNGDVCLVSASFVRWVTNSLFDLILNILLTALEREVYRKKEKYYYERDTLALDD